jgi:hypothetical protein
MEISSDQLMFKQIRVVDVQVNKNGEFVKVVPEVRILRTRNRASVPERPMGGDGARAKPNVPFPYNNCIDPEHIFLST